MLSLRFEKIQTNIDSFRGFIDKFSLSSQSEALGGGGDKGGIMSQ